ncbi:MAG: T9SS type A sorting domain-containing protein [Saprospiraceae bacterium]|nr:T9SS type A sorting domain-containing protein [Saprospiraceae bacterium]
MRTILLLPVLAILTNVQLSHAQETWLPLVNVLPDSFGVSTISAVNEDVIWAVAVNWSVGPPVPPDHVSKVLRSTDGGESWEVHDVEEARGRLCWKIVGIDDTTAWLTSQNLGAAGGRGLFKTTDGGHTWQEKFNHPAGGGALHFFDEQVAVCINWPRIAYTFDGGQFWQFVPAFESLNPEEDEYFIFISTIANSFPVVGDTIWFGTTKGRLLRSADRGRSWTERSFGLGEVQVYSLAFADSKNGLGVYIDQDSVRQVIRTMDGGDTWHQLAVPNELGLLEITHLPGTAHTFAGVSYEDPPQTAFTYDFGDTWVISPDTISAAAITFLSSEVGWMADGNDDGNTPDIYQFNSDFLSSSHANELVQKVTVFPNPFQTSINLELQNLSIEDISLFNAAGQAITLNPLQTQQERITISTRNNIAPGVYFLRVTTHLGILFKKLVKGG